VGVAQEPGLQRRAVPKGCSEVLGGDAHSLPFRLDQITVWAALDPKHDRQARHALRTNHPDLDPALRGVGEDRHDALFGKGDVLDRLPCLDQPVAKVEGNGLKIGL